MMFMSHDDIDDAADRYGDDATMGPAVRSLASLANWTNRNSDGWGYWPKPTRAAARLMAILQSDAAAVTDADVRRALAPIKAFRTRQGATFPLFDASGIV